MVEKCKGSLRSARILDNFLVIGAREHATIRDFFLSDNYSRLGA